MMRVDDNLFFREARLRPCGSLEIEAALETLLRRGNKLGYLGLMADGVNQYTDEHARLLRGLSEPLLIAMSNAMEHQAFIRFKRMLSDDNRYLMEELRSISGDEIIGADLSLSMVMKMDEQVVWR